MKDLRQTEQYAKFMESIGWIVKRKDSINYFIKKFPLIGSFIKIQRPEKINFQYFDELATKYRAFQIVIEPVDQYQVLSIKNKGYKQSKTPFVPSKTIHIDLTKSEKQLLKEMHYKTRYNIRKFNHKPLTINYSKDIKSFADFWQKCAIKQRGMYLSQKKEIIELYKAFNKHADIVSVIHSNELVTGILLLHTDKISYYMYAASSDKGKKLFAPTLVVWEAIKLSKKRGSEIFDFEGIYDKRFPLKSWLGFTRFKKSFGGYEIEYPGSFTKYRFPF